MRQKWHTARRKVLVGDVVLIQDTNQMRRNWKLEIVSQTDPGDDGKLGRREYSTTENPKPGEAVEKYQGRDFHTVQRAVHRLIFLVPADNRSSLMTLECTLASE